MNWKITDKFPLALIIFFFIHFWSQAAIGIRNSRKKDWSQTYRLRYWYFLNISQKRLLILAQDLRTHIHAIEQYPKKDITCFYGINYTYPWRAQVNGGDSITFMHADLAIFSPDQMDSNSLNDVEDIVRNTARSGSLRERADLKGRIDKIFAFERISNKEHLTFPLKFMMMHDNEQRKLISNIWMLEYKTML